jgi:1-acyl-sn-glycerol-3-phosphate acyltransferase
MLPEARVSEANADAAKTAPPPPTADRDPRRGMLIRPWFWETILLFAKILTGARHRIVVRGAEKAPKGAVLLAVKHGSGWDIPLMAAFGRKVLGRRSYFQMGSFIGYPVLGRIGVFMRWCGGFSVMRPKELRRLREREGLSKDALHARMESVNRAAEETRRAVLENGGVLIFFPEGTRDPSQVLPLKATHEVSTAVALRFDGIPSVIWPIAISYGRPRFPFRRRVLIDCADPLPVHGVSAAPLCAEIERRLRATWSPPSSVDG